MQGLLFVVVVLEHSDRRTLEGKRNPLAAWTTVGRVAALASLLGISGCLGELTALAAMAFGLSAGAWILGRQRQRLALAEAETLRLAIGQGEQRALEERLRKELALVEAGEAVSPQREWLARAQLGGLLVAEWRLDEAREVYGSGHARTLAPHLQALAAFGRHELALLTEDASDARWAAIQRDRDACLQFVPHPFRDEVAHAWNAIEGLCLIRMGRVREGAPLIERGLDSLRYNPALVVYLFHLGQAYEHLGERKLAAARYSEAMHAFPGTRLAVEAKTRLAALGPGASDSVFRHMLPEAPSSAGMGASNVADRDKT